MRKAILTAIAIVVLAGTDVLSTQLLAAPGFGQNGGRGRGSCDGTGKGQGKGAQSGKRTGPQDGSGPIHTPQGGGARRGARR
ncbi:MAG: hypothetical protein ABFD60_00040 [Bryobacteraceae bacterium]